MTHIPLPIQFYMTHIPLPIQFYMTHIALPHLILHGPYPSPHSILLDPYPSPYSILDGVKANIVVDAIFVYFFFLDPKLIYLSYSSVQDFFILVHKYQMVCPSRGFKIIFPSETTLGNLQEINYIITS